jgi:acetyl-CoA synthetase
MVLDQFISKSDFSSYEDFFDNFKIILPPHFNFAYDVVDEIAKQEPKKIALVWYNEKGDERIFTFEDIKAYSSRAAHFFKSYSIKKGDKVMLLLKRRYEFWFCLLGLHRIGAISIPATHLLTAKDIVYRNNTAGIKMIVAINEPEIIKHVEDAEAGSLTVQHKVLIGGNRSGWIDFDLECAGTQDFYERPTGENAIDNDDSMLIYFTSGTTGMPKMVQHNFTYPLGHIVTAKYWQCVQDNKLHLTLAETGWAKAMWGKIYGQWFCGAVVFVYDFDRFNPKNLLHIISKYKIATFCAPPTVYRLLFEEDFKQYDLSFLEYCSIAGEAYDRGLFEEFHKRTGLTLKEAYGQTETTVVLGTFPWIEPKPCSMGKPAPGYYIDILNEKGEPCKIGEKGELAICVDKNKIPIGLFCGYHQDKEYTRQVWHDGFYYTGDIAWKDENGYYWFVGRADNLIKSSGYRIGPFEVESVLLEHPAVRECVVSGVPDPDRGQVVKATIVLNNNYEPGPRLVKALQDHVKSITAPYKYPRFIEFTREIPKTGSGKIKRLESKNQK